MPNYYVTYPVVGEITVCVQADSERDAIDKGIDLVDTEAAKDFFTWEAVEHAVRGNVFYGPTAHASADETDDDPFESEA